MNWVTGSVPRSVPPVLALALCLAVPAPIAAVASERVTGMHKHRAHMHHVVRGSFKAATALAAAVRDRSDRSGREV